jgi:hypothetical protein
MKQLKNSFFLLALLLLPVWGMAQGSPAQQWIRSFEGKTGVTTVSISSTMFKMLSKVNSKDPEYQEISRFASKLQDFKIVVVEDEDKKSMARSEFARLIGKAPLSNYEELMSVNEGGNHIVFRVLERNDQIQELIMTITGEDQVILFIKGDFRLSELTKISDDMNITGMNKIKKLKK